MDKPLIYDIFPFFNELDILELRLRMLGKIVGHTIVVQGDETHSGLPKPRYFDPLDLRWLPWAGKISTVTVPRIPDAPTRWVRENAARHVMADALVGADDDDLVIVSDVDEIPDDVVLTSCIPQVVGDTWVGFSAWCAYYYLNLWIPTPYPCIALARIGTVRALGAQALRNKKTCPPVGPVLGGWHFTFMGGVEAIQTKLAAFAHAEYDTDAMKDPAWIAHHIAIHKLPQRGKWRYLYPSKLSSLPLEVQQHPDRYAHLLLPETVHGSV